MIHARPQLNGNTVEDFTTAFYALGEAEKALEAAIRSLVDNVLHGRNYQHIMNTHVTSSARMDDARRLEEMRDAVRDVTRLKLDIVAAIQPRSRRTKVPGCPSCENDEHGPAHFASPNCKSGGHNHCSCDTCF